VAQKPNVGLAHFQTVATKRVAVFKGLPAQGAKIDREDGLFEVYESKLSVFSLRLKKVTKEELGWEVVVVPEPKEEYLETEKDGK
jgi:hypothetical protein